MIPRSAHSCRAFSLVEVLLAIFILGIGVIAVAALFPAGIAQQRRSVDDVIGAVVANNALSVLRLKLNPDDFGTFEEFTFTAPLATIEGDWPWLRPGLVIRDGPLTPMDERGWYDVFSEQEGIALDLASEFSPDGFDDGDPLLFGIPYNLNKWPAHPGKPPMVLISQGERYYPIAPDAAFIDPSAPRPKPQFVWDCMFRRYQGKILVAIFVYRVQLVGGDTVTYAVPPNYSNPRVPPLPVNLEIANLDDNPDDAWNGSDDPVVLGTPSDDYDARDQDKSWQEPRQWLLDQNNNVHRVLSRMPQAGSAPNLVELVRPVSAVPYLATNFMDSDGNGPVREGVDNIVTNIWYIPVEVELDINGDLEPDGIPVQLTPVYATVREL
ncbi:MAG: type IV pilus modification PilV family protein [Planctomycetota bacterium]|jgi:prepilin-type N-terminal cleavage/methylation domain-containing protein